MNVQSLNFSTVYETRDYSIFAHLHDNRQIKEKPELERSMRKHGFIKACHIMCRKICDDKKLEIIRGNHRFIVAKMLKLPIYFMIDNSSATVSELEQPGEEWRVKDFVHKFAKSGNKNYLYLLDFANEHKLPITLSAKLLSGRSPCDGGSVTRDVKDEKFVVGDMSFCGMVVDVIKACEKAGIVGATKGSFIRALSAMLKCEEIQLDRFVRKIQSYTHKIVTRSEWKEWLDEFEKIYNFGLRDKVALKLLVLSKKKAK